MKPELESDRRFRDLRDDRVAYIWRFVELKTRAEVMRIIELIKTC